MTLSAICLKGASFSLSSRMPSMIEPSGARGWVRLVSLKRRRIDSSVASKKRISIRRPFSLSWTKICGYFSRNACSRRSMTIATCEICLAGSDWICRNFDSKTTGRLSTQKKPMSSSARKAVLLPEPESPVIMTTRSCFILIPPWHSAEE